MLWASRTPAMIHRDVKTTNVLLVHERCGDWLANTKVADFGIWYGGTRGRRWIRTWTPA